MRHKIAIAMSLLALAASAGAGAVGFDAVQRSAMAGDYQAQRNLAYGYGSAPYVGQERNVLLACAWRQVITRSGSPKVNDNDIANERIACAGLKPDELAAATAQARRLYRAVYAQAMP